MYIDIHSEFAFRFTNVCLIFMTSDMADLVQNVLKGES